MATLFSINGNNVTSDMEIQEYVMDMTDEYTEWMDGSGTRHRDVYRTRISGTFRLGYKNGTDYAAFQTMLAAAKQSNNSYPVSAYVNNTDTTESFDAFLTTSTSVKRVETNGRIWYVVTVTVEER